MAEHTPSREDASAGLGTSDHATSVAPPHADWSGLRLGDDRLQALLDDLQELGALLSVASTDSRVAVSVAYNVRSGDWECRVLVDGVTRDGPAFASTIYGALENMADRIRVKQSGVRSRP